MKKFLVIISVICLISMMLSLNVFASTDSSSDLPKPSSDTVIRVTAETDDGKVVLITDKNNFADGWNAAIELADNQKEMRNKNYSRVIVDLYANWTAGPDGEFCNSGDGFNWDAIYFPENVKVTLNLNGHTIDRAIASDTWQYNGEVMYIDADADVIINNGTITGGYSCNGAGGIHINDNANVILNDVNVIGNKVEDDDGAGIAIYDGAKLIMNGGSISNNSIDSTYKLADDFNFKAAGGGFYAEDSEVVLNNVKIENNQALVDDIKGIAFSSKNSDVTLNNCTVTGNGVPNAKENHGLGISIIMARNSNISFINTTFTNNGGNIVEGEDMIDGTILVRAKDSYIYMDSCTATSNIGSYLFSLEDVRVNINNSEFVDNNSYVLLAGFKRGEESSFTNCKFNNNDLKTWKEKPFFFGAPVVFYDCDMGDSKYLYAREYAKFITTSNDDEPKSENLMATMIGNGSLSVIISMVALAIAISSVTATVTYNKKIKLSSVNKDSDNTK